MLAAAVQNDREKKPDSISTEKPEAQSISYRRSRDVALMKLALLRAGERRSGLDHANPAPNEADIVPG